jgi:hypothetical protein
MKTIYIYIYILTKSDKHVFVFVFVKKKKISKLITTSFFLMFELINWLVWPAQVN